MMGCVRLLVLGVPVWLASLAGALAEERLVAVQMNGQPISDGELVDFDGERIVVPADLAHRLRLKLGADAADRIDLHGVAGVTTHFDETTQTLKLDVDPSLIETTVIGGFLRDRPYDRTNSVGLFANYTLLAQGGGGQPLASSLFDLGLFAPLGTVSTDVSASNINGVTRLQTHYGTELDGGDKLTVGDDFLFAGALGQSFPFAGFSLASRSATEGGHATTPVQSILGQAALPSTVDVFVNDALQSRQAVEAGPFSIENLPTVTGDGEVRVVVHDVLGRDQVITKSFFGSQRLLEPDTDQYAFETGLLRRDFGTQSFDYAEPFAAGTWLHGVTDWLTTELHSEVSTEREMFGGQLSAAVGHFGVLHLGGAGSDARTSGVLGTAGFDGQVGKLTFGLSSELSTRGFSQLGYIDQRTLRETSQAHASLNLGADGSVDLSFLRFHLDGQHLSSTVASGYSVSFGNWLFADLSVSDNVTHPHDVGGFLTFSVSFGDGTTASTSANRADRKWQVDVQANTPVPATEGFSYSGAAQYGSFDQTQLSALYRDQLGDFSASVGSFGGAAVGRVTASGSVELIDGRIYASRQENGAFALVETDEPGIHVAVDQLQQGVTDDEGELFIPHLRPGELNHITVDPADVPLDANLPTTEQAVVPHTGAGYVVQFPVHHQHSATLRLVTADGLPVRAGAPVRLARTGGTTTVGLDGTVYLDDVQDGDEIDAATGGGCKAILHLPTAAALQYQLGQVTCAK
jgi:outer membrane usher protein